MHLLRPHLTSLLYEGFRCHEERIRTSVDIQDIEIDDTRVLVKLQDGSVEQGAIVIGCDGVHSQIRSISKYSSI